MHKINADLHSHSTFSDGVLSPFELASRAHSNGVALWALTDHDELGGIKAAREASVKLGMSFVSGVEISVTWAKKTIHIVGLNVDEDSDILIEGLMINRSGREDRAKKIAQALEQHFNLRGVLDGAMQYVGNPRLISRSHFARYLVECKVAPSSSEVFKHYLVDGKPGFIAHQWTSLSNAIRWIRASGGVSVLAHPGRYGLSMVQQNVLIDEFKHYGGLAIETVTGSHTADQFIEFDKLAKHNDLFVSRGSDFHSEQDATIDIGLLPPINPTSKPVWQLFK